MLEIKLLMAGNYNLINNPQSITEGNQIGQLYYLLLPFLFPFVLSVLQHLFFPQVKKVGGVGVKLQGFLVIISKQTNTKRVILTYRYLSVTFVLTLLNLQFL